MEERKGSGNTLFAVIICLGIWMGWQYYLEKKYPQPKTPTTTEQTEIQTKATAQESNQAQIKNAPKIVIPANIPEKTITLENQELKILVSSLGGAIKEAKLKKNETPIISQATDKGSLYLKTIGATTTDFSDTNFSIDQKNNTEAVLLANKEGITIKKSFRLVPEKYLLEVKIETLTGAEKIKQIEVATFNKIPEKENTSIFAFSPPTHYQEYYFEYKNKTERDQVTHDSEVKKEHEQVHVAALGTRYFTNLFLNRSSVLPQAQAERTGDQSVLKMKYPLLDSSQTLISFDLFLGPKSLSILKNVDEAAAKVIDYGMFSWIALPLLGIMKWFYSMIGNYGIAIILLTILVRVLTFPFTYVSYKSMRAMQVIQPEIAKLKEKFKGDNKTLNVEMMKLMRENKVNPAGGCVPMLLQLPIFWALYQVLQNSIELHRSPFYFWIHDLSQKDPFYVLPVLMGIAMFIQQKMMPSTMDPAQQKVMLFMPVFFSFLMFGLPSGLTLYILISTVFGIIQQMLMTGNTKPQKA